MIQSSYKNNNFGNLYIVPTPIGNMEDITLRALKILKEVDIIFAEDTRITLILLNKYNIHKKIESCHKYSEMKNKDNIIKKLKEGKNIALVSDRGTPLISDPGNIIVSEAIKYNINVIALPGASALLPALNMSGLNSEKFLFYGFLNSKDSTSKKELRKIKDFEYTLVFYESPHRVKRTLSNMLEILGDRKMSLVREISKIYEEVNRDNISNILKKCDKIKGEIVLVVEGSVTINEEIDYVNEVNMLVNQGKSKSSSIKEIAEKYNISKNKLYEITKE
ncbi:MAG: 16S rRNA (cytidine(1402)-2'-O)-methyltransferase [Tenericutes bacterium]|nr:16S rRNA (cytidine(1402)-2'-O)-methyltransferase [Mycoplasmatota bacterium]